MNRKVVSYLLAFLIPFLLFNIVFLILDASFISSNNVLISDVQAQYYPLFTYYQNIFDGTESIFYSFNSGLGNSMMSTFAYYLSSPLNLLLLLFDENNLYKGISLLITLKIALAGLTMYIYLDKKVNGKKIYALLFSTCYAMMAYVVNYYFNIMWLDGVFITPLVLLGIDHILKGKKPILFGISLFYTVLTNYYIAYMIILFSFIYFWYSLFVNNQLKDKKEVFKYFKRYIITGILSTLIASFILIPGIVELTNSNKSTMNIFVNMFQILQNPLDVFSKTFIGTHSISMIINEDTINIYIGLLSLPLLFLYIVNKDISKREKIGFSIVFIIFILSVIIRPLHMIWHGFSLPNGFNYRNSFLFCLFFLLIACKSLNKINYNSIKQFIIFYLIYVILSMLVLFFVTIPYPKYYIYISLIIVFLYLLLLYNIRKNIKDIIILIFIMSMAELFFNTYISYKDYVFNENEIYDKYINDTTKQINKYNDKNDFYRIEKTSEFTSNDSLLFNYKGISYFLSTSNKNVNNFLRNMGLTGYNLNISYSVSSTQVIDSLFGIKYIISKEELPYYNLIDYIETKENNSKPRNETYIYENSNFLNIGYMITNVDKNINESNNYFEYQNRILNSILNNDFKYFKETQYIMSNDNYIVNKDDESDVYVYLNFEKNNDNVIVLYVDDLIYKTFDQNITMFRMPATLRGRNLNLKVRNNNIDTPYSGKVTVNIYTFDEKLFNESISVLKDEQLNIESISNTKISGNINVKESGTMLLTIPYQKGFSVYVDNKLTEYYKVFDTFIGIDLKDGNHTITISYETPYLKESIIVSIISLGLLILYIRKQR